MSLPPFNPSLEDPMKRYPPRLTALELLIALAIPVGVALAFLLDWLT